jgi:excisionase family DNA binding protein
VGTLAGDSGAALEPLLSIDDVADYLGVSVTTIYDWRVAGKGPRAIKVGRHLRFAVSDLMAWVGAQREARPGDAPTSWPPGGGRSPAGASGRSVPPGR